MITTSKVGRSMSKRGGVRQLLFKNNEIFSFSILYDTLGVPMVAPYLIVGGRNLFSREPVDSSANFPLPALLFPNDLVRYHRI